jgi:hypothetical protein
MTFDPLHGPQADPVPSMTKLHDRSAGRSISQGWQSAVSKVAKGDD